MFRQGHPPSFTNVNATRNSSNGPVLVSFTVSHESAINHYEIERNGNGVNFQNVLIIDPIGNNCGTYSYTAIDQLLLWAINYYRIKGLKNNGNAFYSSIVKLSPGKDFLYGKHPYDFATTEVMVKYESTIKIHPNTVVKKLMRISFVNKPSGVYKLKLINSIGQIMFTKTIQLMVDTKVDSIAIGETDIASNYYLKVIDDAGISIEH